MKDFSYKPELTSGLGHTQGIVSNGMTEIFKIQKLSNRTNRLINASIAQDDDEDYILDSPRVKTALITVYSLVFLFCFFGNLTVILVIKLHWRMRSVTKFCLGNLAFANLCVGIFCVYQNLSLYLIDSWVFGEFLCKMYHFVNTLSHTASILILVVITIERYLVIMYPFKCRRILTIQRLRVIVIGVWILSAIISSPRLYYIELIPNPTYWKKSDGKTGYEVLCTLGDSMYTSKTVDLIQFASLFLLPLLIMTVLYTKIILYLRKRDTLASFYAITSWAKNDNDPPSTSQSHTEVSTEDLSTRSFKFSRQPQQQPRVNSQSRRKSERTCIDFKQVSQTTRSSSLSGSTVIRIEENQFCDQCVNQVLVESEMSILQKLRRKRRKVPGSKLRQQPISQKLHRQSTMIRINFSNNNSKKSCGGGPARPEITAIRRPHSNVVGILVLIVGTFAFCNFPFYLRKLYKNYIHRPEYESDFTELVTPISFIMMYANCAINPFLYAFMSKSFRASFHDLIKCNLKRPTQH